MQIATYHFKYLSGGQPWLAEMAGPTVSLYCQTNTDHPQGDLPHSLPSGISHNERPSKDYTDNPFWLVMFKPCTKW